MRKPACNSARDRADLGSACSRLTRCLLLGTIIIASVTGHARADGSDKAAAEALFDEGRKLMAAGRFEEACTKLEASQRLDAGVGTQLNLADCYEKSGKTASAWAQFREAGAAAHKAGSKQREDIARKRAAALESQLSYLTIDAGGQTPLNVTRNGIAVDAALLGGPIPVDPGQQVIAATAPGKQAWTNTLRIAANADRVNVRVPALAEAAVAVSSDVPPPAAASAEIARSEASEPSRAPEAALARDSDSGSTQRILGWISAGIGVAGIAVGTGFGIDAMQSWSASKKDCDPQTSGPARCGAQGYRDGTSAGKSADIATIGFIVGAAGAAGALVLWLSAPSATTDAHAALGLRPDGVTLRGTF